MAERFPAEPFKWNLPCSFIWMDDIDPEEIRNRAAAQGATESQIVDIIYASNPIVFSKMELGLDMTQREYQEEALLCTSKKIVKRMARRLGKTVGMIVRVVHFALFRPNRKIIIFTPFVHQAERFFVEIQNLAYSAPYLMDRIRPIRGSDNLFKKSPNLQMTFRNGTTIEGFSTGGGTKDRSSKMRGGGVIGLAEKSGGLIIGDEVDWLGEEGWTVMNPMIDERNMGKLLVHSVIASTPTGKREQFYDICKGSQSRYYKEIHRTIYDEPGITEEVIRLRRSGRSREYFEREYLAEFGDEVTNEFKYSDLLRCLDESAPPYPRIPRIGDPERGPIDPNPDPIDAPGSEIPYRCIGIDWNGPEIGNRFVVLEHDNSTGHYKLVGRYSIARHEFNNRESINMVRALNAMYHPQFIYCDAGFGQVTVENIRVHSLGAKPGTPDFRLKDVVKPIEMRGSTEVYDKAAREWSAKENKPFMIELAKHSVEAHIVDIPPFEYPKDPDNIGFVEGLMRLVSKITATGRRSWEQDHDHDTIAFSLAVMAFVVELGDLCKPATHGGGVMVNRGYIPDATTGVVAPNRPGPESPQGDHRSYLEAPAVTVRGGEDHPGYGGRAALGHLLSNDVHMGLTTNRGDSIINPEKVDQARLSATLVRHKSRKQRMGSRRIPGI